MNSGYLVMYKFDCQLTTQLIGMRQSSRLCLISLKGADLNQLSSSFDFSDISARNPGGSGQPSAQLLSIGSTRVSLADRRLTQGRT